MTSNSSTNVIAEDQMITRPHSLSSYPSNSTSGAQTIESSPKITLTEQDTCSADAEPDLLKIEEYKSKYEQAKHWKVFKIDLKKYVAKMKSKELSKKFEIE